MRTSRSSKRTAILLMVFSSLLPAMCEKVKDSVLGFEPGDRRLQNDDIGIILWGPDSAPTLSVGKSDVWDRRNPESTKPVITLQEIIQGAKVGDPSIVNGAAYYDAYGSYDFPCPKPVGQLILKLPFMKSDGKLTVDPQDRMIRLQAERGKKSLDLRLFVSSIRNLIVVDGQSEGLKSGDIEVRLYRHNDTIVPGGELHPTLGSNTHSATDFDSLSPPYAGYNENAFWIAQDFPGEKTFTNGFTTVLAASLDQAEVIYETVEGEANLGTPMVAEKEGRLDHGTYKRFTPINTSPGAAVTARPANFNDSFRLFVTVTTTQDDPNPLLRAQHDLAEAIHLGVAALWEEHEAQLDAYEARPHARAWKGEGETVIDANWGGVPYRVRPSGYYGDIPLCSVDSTKFCFQDSARWHADFHFNELDATNLCIQRQFDLLDAYFRMIHTMLPMAQANAREVYDCSGAMYPLVHYPLKAETVIHTHMTWEQSVEITALIVRPFWQRFLYSWDTEFLRELAYPVLREGARYYADYLKLSEDGLYHVFPTVSPEHRGITKDLKLNRDSQSAIALIRYHLRAAAKSAELLETDAGESERWRDIAEHMPPYPTLDTPRGPIFTDVEGGEPMEFNIAVPLTAVFWGDDIGLDSPPEQIELAKRTLETIDVWKPHRGYLARVRKRLGIHLHSDGLSTENYLQSHTGVIRLFPAVTANFEGGFENFGAQGAFVVSATRTKTGVQSVKISSLAGNRCRIAKFWVGNDQPQITEYITNEVIPARQEGPYLEFETKPDHEYRIEFVKNDMNAAD